MGDMENPIRWPRLPVNLIGAETNNGALAATQCVASIRPLDRLSVRSFVCLFVQIENPSCHLIVVVAHRCE